MRVTPDANNTLPTNRGVPAVLIGVLLLVFLFGASCCLCGFAYTVQYNPRQSCIDRCERQASDATRLIVTCEVFCEHKPESLYSP